MPQGRNSIEAKFGGGEKRVESRRGREGRKTCEGWKEKVDKSRQQGILIEVKQTSFGNFFYLQALICFGLKLSTAFILSCLISSPLPMIVSW